MYNVTLAMLLLAGCVGTSVATPNNQLPAPERNFDTIYAAHNALEQSALNSTIVPFSYAIIPSSNNYLFQGFVSLIDESLAGSSHQQSLVGTMNIDLFFDDATASITGDIGNLINNSGEEFSGTLNLIGGKVFPGVDVSTAHSVTSTIEGSLTNPTGDLINVVGGLEGDFRGLDFLLLSGNSSLLYQTNGNVQTFTGSFVLNR